MKKAVTGIILTLLLTGMLTLASNLQPVKAGGTIYIRADGSVDPPDTPITTIDNVTYTLTGNITTSDDGIFVERDNIIIDGNGYTVQGSGTFFSRGIILAGRSNVTIKNTRIMTFHFGITTLDHEIWIDSYSYASISRKNIANNWGSISLSSSGIRVTENKIQNNWHGIYLTSSYGSISGNNITANEGWGISLTYSSGNSISGNNITANGWAGIYLEFCSSNSINGNNIANNGNGVQLTESSSNIIAGNNITNNEYGIMLDWFSPSNNFYHNSFNNTNQVCSSDSANVWDNGYPSGGNHWSDYTGVDEKNGPNQDQPGNDSIGDTPYVIDGYNIDRYPLMKPWTPIPSVIETCNSSGAKKDSFIPGETVYINGTGFAPSTTYNMYVVSDVTWTDGMPIPARISGTTTSVTSDPSGNIPPTVAWQQPLNIGKFDVLIDVNDNGNYDAGVDALDDNDIVNTAGLLIIPEYWLGTILGLAGCFAAFGAFHTTKRKRI